jgi:hypothetical protein
MPPSTRTGSISAARVHAQIWFRVTPSRSVIVEIV